VSWLEVTKAAPCPACEKGDWCRRDSENGAVLCNRDGETPTGMAPIPSSWKQPESGRMFVMADWLNGNGHGSNGHGGLHGLKIRKPPQDRAAEAEGYRQALTPELRGELADGLGVPVEVLGLIGVGWCESGQCWTFPEVNAEGMIIGINRRFRDGTKKTFPGHRRGLVVPSNLAELPDPVVAAEGASCVLACLASDVAAVGRPSNTHGAAMLAELLKGRQVIVVGERDEKPDGSWPGRDGAIKIATQLAEAWGCPVTWAMPPRKDMRATYLDYEGDGGLLDLLQDRSVVEPKILSQPDEVARLDPLSAKKLKARIFEQHDTNESSGLQECELLAEFADRRGFEVLGLIFTDDYGREHRSLSIFAAVWQVENREVRRKIQVGRLAKEITGQLARHLSGLTLHESHFRALLPLEGDHNRIESVIVEAVRIAKDEAIAKGSKAKPRLTARVIGKAVRRALEIETTVKELWQIVGKCHTQAMKHPDRTEAGVEHLRLAVDSFARHKEATL